MQYANASIRNARKVRAAAMLSLWLSACASQYRQDFEIDARGKAADTCHAIGVGPNDKGYYDCFQSHLTALMASAPTDDRPVPAHLPTDWEVCESYGFKFGTDAFGACLQRRDEERARIATELLRTTAPISCQSIRLGLVTTTQCN